MDIKRDDEDVARKRKWEDVIEGVELKRKDRVIFEVQGVLLVNSMLAGLTNDGVHGV